MLRFFCIALVMFIAVGSIISCDPDKNTITDPPVVLPEPLKEKDNTLFHLELLFNEYNLTEYDKLLDDDFVFSFSAADFSSGKTPEQWARVSETTAYNNFFDDTRSENRVSSRSLNLTYAADNWTEITPDDPITYPGESWYVTTVLYDMSIVLDTEPQLTLVANGLKAGITIRWAAGPGHWRIIRWRDDVDGGRRLLTRNAAVEETTWGSIKVLYDD